MPSHNRLLGRGSAVCPSTGLVEGSRLILATASSFAGRLTSLAVGLGALVGLGARAPAFSKPLDKRRRKEAV